MGCTHYLQSGRRGPIDSHLYANSYQHRSTSDSDAHQYGCASDRNSNYFANADPNSYRNRHTDPNSNRFTDPDVDSDSNPDSHWNNGYSNLHTNAYGNYRSSVTS